MTWQSEAEDLLVANPTNNSLAFIDPTNAFVIRKTIVDARLAGARSVIAMPRETASGLYNGVYLAYILNGNDEVVVYESGPSTLGYDDLIGTVGTTFPSATTMQPFVPPGFAGFLIGHVDSGGLGVVSRIEVVGPGGTQPAPGQPSLRGKFWRTVRQFGGFQPSLPSSTLLSGNVVADIAYDDITNAGALLDFSFGRFQPNAATHSGKSFVKDAFGIPIPATFPRMLLIALGDTGRVDVIDIFTGARVTSIPTPGVRSLAHYWRQ